MSAPESALTRKVDFNILRYAGCWEDADILLKALKPKPASRILSIGSGGDNSLALLSAEPELVVAADLSAVQLHMIALKKTAFQKLSHADLLSFLGIHPSPDRRATYAELREVLSAEAVAYWDAHLKDIKKGVIFSGKFERYFGYFSKRILPLIHGRKKVNALFERKSAHEQQEFYSARWNTWRWRLFFKLFFSRYIMGKFGRDPQFLKEVDLTVHDYIFGKAERHLSSIAAQDNYFLAFILRGKFSNSLPFYLREENFEVIKRNIHKLELYHGRIEDALGKAQFDCLNLSNIFEYMDKGTFRDVSEKILHGLHSGARLAYWNLMVPRRISAEFPDKVEFDENLSASLSQRDKGFFYDRFIIDVIK